jgi:alpha-ketoglutarate-dependent taurine dioxygenase
MKYSIHENGWTVLLDDFDFNTATQDDINQIAKFLATNTLVVVRNQRLSVADELRAVNMFKNPQPLFTPEDNDFIHCAADLTQDPTGVLCRVSGELNEHGMEGIAGYVDEMVWHCNQPFKQDRAPLVWLYGVHGTAGSRTTWNNNILSYNDLSQENKDFLATLQICAASGFDNGDGFLSVEETFTPNVVQTNNAGKTGLFFPFLQFRNFVGMTEQESIAIVEPLRNHILQEKYIYHHDWQDGDVVIAEQWLGIHKRWKFEGMNQRVLHRITFDFNKSDLSSI